MEYLIKIDQNTITENENEGQRFTVVIVRRDVNFTCSKMPDFFKDGENIHVTEWGDDFFKGIIVDPEIEDKVIKNNIKGYDLKIDIDLIQERISHPPISKYSYGYLNTQIKCDNCNKEIMSDDLESDSWDCMFSDTICPKCGITDCCELKYEKIESVT